MLPLLYIHLHVKHPLFLSVFKGKLISSTDFQKIHKCQISWITLQWEHRCSMRTLVGLDEAGSHFSKFSEKAQEANDLPWVTFRNFPKKPKKPTTYRVPRTCLLQWIYPIIIYTFISSRGSSDIIVIRLPAVRRWSRYSVPESVTDFSSPQLPNRLWFPRNLLSDI